MLSQRDCSLIEMEGRGTDVSLIAGRYCCSETRQGQGKGTGVACTCSGLREMGVTDISLEGGSGKIVGRWVPKAKQPTPLPQVLYFLTGCLFILGSEGSIPEVWFSLLDALLHLPLELWGHLRAVDIILEEMGAPEDP